MNYKVQDIVDNGEVKIRLLEYKTVDSKSLNLSVLKSIEIEKFNSFTSEKRKLEFYFTRVLLKTISIDVFIVYKASGKPLINDGHISISHSRNSIVIAYSKEKVIGVDIEFYSPKIERIKFKFLSDYEKENIDVDNQKNLTIIWSIKEAIYKMEDLQGLIFKEHIIVKSIANPGEVKVIKNEKHHDYEFGQIIKEEFVITYCYLDN